MKNNLELLSLIKSISKAKIIWFGFEDYLTNDHILFGSKYMLSGLIDRVNLSLSEILTDDVFVDFKKLIAYAASAIHIISRASIAGMRLTPKN